MRTSLLIGMLLPLWTTGGAIAGELGPPAGPIAPTMRTLAEVEPRIPVGPLTTPGDSTSVYRIDSGGAYYLTSDVVGELGKHGIVIASSDVTLDLSGFSVRGVAGALDGLHVEGDRYGLRIVDGRVLEWPGDGVDGATAHRSQFVDLSSTNNGEDGLRAGTLAQIRGVTADANGAEGIQTSNRARVSSCSAAFNLATNIVVTSGSLVQDCVASNSTAGSGIEASAGSLVESCVANNNALSGVRAVSRTSVLQCQTSFNGEHGVHITFAGRVESTFANMNGVTGIRMDNGGAVSILNCTVSESPTGILVSVSQGNRIEGNTVTFCTQVGILVESAGNVVVRNHVGNTLPTQYSVVGNNIFGPVVTVSTAGTNDNPHANYRF